jgi:hypothetical protein
MDRDKQLMISTTILYNPETGVTIIETHDGPTLIDARAATLAEALAAAESHHADACGDHGRIERALPAMRAIHDNATRKHATPEVAGKKRGKK